MLFLKPKPQIKKKKTINSWPNKLEFATLFLEGFWFITMEFPDHPRQKTFHYHYSLHCWWCLRASALRTLWWTSFLLEHFSEMALRDLCPLCLDAIKCIQLGPSYVQTLPIWFLSLQVPLHWIMKLQKTICTHFLLLVCFISNSNNKKSSILNHIRDFALIFNYVSLFHHRYYFLYIFL